MKIAAVQFDVQFGALQTNLERIKQFAEQAISEGSELIIFPECSLCGYCCDTIDEAREISIPFDHEYIHDLEQFAEQKQVYLVVGLLELDGDSIFNSLLLIGPEGVVGKYRKTHLPILGVDRFTTPGTDCYGLLEVNGVRIGLLICYDCSFPEPTRILSLQGADLVVLPTNWPSGALITSRLIPPARAMENHIYFAAVNRVGEERGFEFIGNSRICHPQGTDLAFADHNQEEILYAEIDPELAREKRLVRVPGKHEVNLIDHRRPELYHQIAKRN